MSETIVAIENFTLLPYALSAEEVKALHDWFVLASFGIPKEPTEEMGEAVPSHVVEEK